MHRPPGAGSATGISDREIRRLTMVVVPVAVVALLAFGASAGASPIRVVVLAIVGGTFILTGLLAWARRPANRTGRVMVATGSFLMLDILQGGTAPSLAPIGLIGSTISDVLLGYLILSFPFGVLRSTADRVFLALAGAALLSTNVLFFVAFDPRAYGGTYDNPYRVIDDPAFASGTMGLANLTSIVVLVGFLAMFAIRWARASGPARRTLSPVLLPSTALMFAIIIAIVVDGSDLPDDVKFATGATQALIRALIPVGFLVGLLRTRMARSAIVDLVVELGETPAPARLRDALSNALGDPSLTVAYWSPDADAYVGADGARVEARSVDAGRAVTLLERDGQPIAAIVHDEMLLDDPGLVASVASAMRLSVENERLQAEVEAQLGEVRESRARIVAAGDAERRRVERDLHDGAQQRLVSLTLALRFAGSDSATMPIRRSGSASTRPPRRHAPPCPNSVSLPAASIPRSSRRRVSGRPSSHSPIGRPSSSPSSSARTSASRRRSRRPPTSSSRRHSPTSRSTPALHERTFGRRGGTMS